MVCKNLICFNTKKCYFFCWVIGSLDTGFKFSAVFWIMQTLIKIPLSSFDIDINDFYCKPQKSVHFFGFLLTNIAMSIIFIYTWCSKTNTRLLAYISFLITLILHTCLGMVYTFLSMKYPYENREDQIFSMVIAILWLCIIFIVEFYILSILGSYYNLDRKINYEVFSKIEASSFN